MFFGHQTVFCCQKTLFCAVLATSFGHQTLFRILPLHVVTKQCSVATEHFSKAAPQYDVTTTDSFVTEKPRSVATKQCSPICKGIVGAAI